MKAKFVWLPPTSPAVHVGVDSPSLNVSMNIQDKGVCCKYKD